jgi:hypothetical protein
MRDYPDTQMHPRDPDPTGICTVRFRAQVLPALTAGGIVLGLLSSSGLL